MKLPVKPLTAVLFVFALSFTLFAVQSGDVFMYLALARDFVLKHKWDFHDPYLYSLPDARLVWAHEYLSYVLFYGAWSVAGAGGLILFKAALLSVIFALALGSRPRSETSSPLWIGFWILAVIAASFRFIERSSLFSDIFCVLLVRLLIDRRRIDRKLIVILSLIFFAWVQLHPGFPLGLGLVGLWAAWNIHGNRDFNRRALPWLLVPVACLFLNPMGWRGVAYPFSFGLNEARVLSHYNFEWFASYHPAFRFAPEVIAFWALSLFSLLALARARAWREPQAWFALFALIAGTQAVRFIPWAAFTLIIATKPWSRLNHVRLPRAATVTLATALLAVAAKNLLNGYNSSSGPRLPRFTLDPAYFPSRTLDFLRQHRIAGHLYNSHDFGAYLIWRGLTPVFHHGFVTDMDFYKNDVVGVFGGPERFQELATRYGWTMLLVEKHNSYRYFYRILSPLPGWKIVAEDPAAYLIYKLP